MSISSFPHILASELKLNIESDDIGSFLRCLAMGGKA